MRVLVTGAAGFIGAAVAARLLDRGDEVVGVDALTPYYDPAIKEARLAGLDRPGFELRRIDVADRAASAGLCAGVDAVIHLAAQVGVRHSLRHPLDYVDANLTGFAHVLEGCRAAGVRHLVFASSSSVYGASSRMPFREDDPADQPTSLYAATKRADELMARAYAHLHRLPSTGLRFFTVYGPKGRPDMAPMRFAAAIREGRAIELYGGGTQLRDFTYVDDAAEAVLRVLDRPPEAFRLLNVASGAPVRLKDFVDELERALGLKALRLEAPEQPGDMPSTWADVSALEALTGFRPSTSLAEGLRRLAETL